MYKLKRHYAESGLQISHYEMHRQTEVGLLRCEYCSLMGSKAFNHDAFLPAILNAHKVLQNSGGKGGADKDRGAANNTKEDNAENAIQT